MRVQTGSEDAGLERNALSTEAAPLVVESTGAAAYEPAGVS